MGGYGSGRTGGRCTVERATRIVVGRGVSALPETTAFPTVPVVWTNCRFGGRRPWFLCPNCDRRRSAVFVVGRHRACRVCLGLAYRSQRLATHDRAVRRRIRCEERIGGSPRFKLITKPRSMHWRTWERLVAAAVDADRRALEAFVGLPTVARFVTKYRACAI